MVHLEEDEWEYEYDENETEDFYITLDLSNVPDKGNAPGPRGSIRPSLSGHPISLHSRLRALTASASRTIEENVDGDEPATNGEMQVTGLHTSKPLIMYNNQLLSCCWASTIGTDMFFVKPNSNPDPKSREQPLRSLHSVDLLAISSTKLMAQAARLRPRDEAIQNMLDLGEQMTDMMDLSGAAQPVLGNAQRADQNNVMPLEEGRSAPDSFLARLNEAKARRGENTRLAMSKNPDGSCVVVAKNVSPTNEASPSTAEDTVME